MLINKIGEFGLIERFRKAFPLDTSVVKGSGDDCAVIKFDKDNYLLATCDMIVEGVDFTRRTDPYLVGRKAIAVSLSDIAACAGIPRYALVSLGLPVKTKLQYADRIRQGMADIARKYSVNIVGGDLSRADKLVIDVSMLGIVEKRHLVLRGGARAGDIIFVTGSLGGSLRGRHLKFTPRLKEARYLAGNFGVSSMIDISDGLVQDLSHITQESSKGAAIYESLIPVNKDARGIADALYGGEDFELLFTMPPAQARRLLKAGQRGFYPIGEILSKKEGIIFIDSQGKIKKIAISGWRHF